MTALLLLSSFRVLSANTQCNRYSGFVTSQAWLMTLSLGQQYLNFLFAFRELSANTQSNRYGGFVTSQAWLMTFSHGQQCLNFLFLSSV